LRTETSVVMSDVERGAHRRIWEIGLAAIKDELGSEPVESLGDLLRLGEKVLEAAGVDFGARFDAMADDAYARIVPRPSRRASSGRSKVLRAQGAYYLVSGLWAVVDRRGFEGVTGRKKDYWLVRTVGLLAGTIGFSLLAGTRGGRPSSETTMLGVTAGASFTAVDLVYVARRRISPVYLGDAAVHALLAAFALRASRESAS
jgi:hypothetical protein